MKTIIYFVRHAQSEGNILDLMGGDFELTDKGKEQASYTAKELSHIPFDAFFVSNKVRTKQTAEIIRGERDTPIIVMPILRERDYGVYDGKRKQDYIDDLPEVFEEYNNANLGEKWTFKYYPSYESDQECASRYIIAVNDILKTHSGKCICIVSHGSVMRILLMELGLIPSNIVHRDIFENAGWVALETDGVHYELIGARGLKLPNDVFNLKGQDI